VVPLQNPLTLEQLWTHYQQEAAGYRQNTKRTQDDKRAAARRLLAFFSAVKRVDLLTAERRRTVCAHSALGARLAGRAGHPTRANKRRPD